MSEFKVVRDGAAIQKFQVVEESNSDGWPFEVGFKDKQVDYIRVLDNGTDGCLYNLRLKAFLKLIDFLRAEGYTI